MPAGGSTEEQGAAPEPAAETREAPGAEDEHDDDENDTELRNSDRPHGHTSNLLYGSVLATHETGSVFPSW